MDKQMLLLLAAGVAGPIIADKVAINYGPADSSGFIPFKPGFGLDDVAVGLAVLGAYVLMRKVV